MGLLFPMFVTACLISLYFEVFDNPARRPPSTVERENPRASTVPYWRHSGVFLSQPRYWGSPICCAIML